MSDTHDRSRAQLVDCMRRMDAAGLTCGTAGNVSCRSTAGMSITPTGIAASAMSEAAIVETDLHGRALSGRFAPSSEWPMHAAIYRCRPDARAIVHCHSRYATALACTGRGIPAFHYMIAVAGGDDVRCAPYALFGSETLAEHARCALDGRRACLLANHGQLTLAGSIMEALQLAIEIEELAAQYCTALAIGGVHILDSSQMSDVHGKFAGYGQPHLR
jgi:L-fuculose-phosphate aldolase